MHKFKTRLIVLFAGLLVSAPLLASPNTSLISTANVLTKADIAQINGDTRDGFRVKEDILSVMKLAKTMAKKSDLAQIQQLIMQVENMGYDEVLGTFNSDFMSSFQQFNSVFNNLETAKVKQVSANAKQTNVSISPQLVTSVNLRNASYSVICGDTRADTDAQVIALAVFLVAEAIKDAAISGCGTVVVVAGFGGSPQSAICSGIVSGVFQIARGVWEEFLLCQDSIDSAEILGTYQRAQDVFNAINEHDTDLKNDVAQHDTNLNTHDDNLSAHDDNLDAHDINVTSNLGQISDGIQQHDTDIKAGLAQHDTDVKVDIAQHDTDLKAGLAQHDTDVKADINLHDFELKAQLAMHDADIKDRLNELETKLDTIIELLNTPSGKRPNWNDKN